MFPGSIVWVEYLLVFGIYPILKAYIERLPRWSWLIVKLLYVNATFWAIFGVVELLLGLPFFEDGALIMKAVTYLLVNVAFIAYDAFITVMVKFYYDRLRRRFFKFLK